MNTRTALAAVALAAAPSALLAQSEQDAAADFYGSHADYATLGRHALERRVLDRAGALTGARGVSAGYLFADVNTPDDFDLQRQDGFVGGEFAFGRGFTAGLLLSGGSGETEFPGAESDADGYQGLVFLTKAFCEKLSGYATLGYGSYDFDSRRATLFGTALGSTDASAFGGSIGARYLVLKQDKLSVSARAGLRYDDAKVDAFTETGVVDLQAVEELTNRQLSLDVGASALWNLTLGGRALDLELTVGVDAPLVDDRDDVRATVVNIAAPYTLSFEDAEVSGSIGANVAYQICKSSRAFAGVEGRAGGFEGVSGQAGLSVNF